MTKSKWSPPTLVALLVIYWSSLTVHAGNILCDDSDLCLSKRFLRFGRGFSQDPYYKIRQQFYRLNRSYQPYQDKRFLRFGRSQLQGLDDLYSTDVAEPFSRKRRSLDTNSQLGVTHDHVRRSIDQSAIEKAGDDEMSHVIKKRSSDDQILGLEGDFNADGTPNMIKKRSIDDMSFGRDFGRDGDGDNEDNSQFEKRFMRFGKRLIPAKRFMRFGRNHGVDSSSGILASAPAKRFMRFGKRKEGGEGDEEAVANVIDQANMHKLSNVLSLANRLKSEAGELDGGLYGTEKRFMRFGKRGAGSRGLDKES